MQHHLPAGAVRRSRSQSQSRPRSRPRHQALGPRMESSGIASRLIHCRQGPRPGPRPKDPRRRRPQSRSQPRPRHQAPLDPGPDPDLDPGRAVRRPSIFDPRSRAIRRSPVHQLTKESQSAGREHTGTYRTVRLHPCVLRPSEAGRSPEDRSEAKPQISPPTPSSPS